MVDQVANFKKVNVSTGYDASATSVVLSAGQGAEMPDPSGDNYNVVWWDSSNYPDPADDPNVEVVRVTGKSTDTLTVSRNQESSGASTKNTSGAVYKMILAPTAKIITDLQSSINLKLAKASNLSDVANATTSFGNIKQGATESATGVIEKATTVECVTGTDTDRAVTPAGVTARMEAPGELGGTTPAAGNFSSVNAPVGRGATLIVAASDSSTLSKNQADYICDGTADDVQIQAAINALPGKVVCMEGTYNISTSIAMISNVHLEGLPGVVFNYPNTSVDLFTFTSGYATTTNALTADPAAGSATITVNDASGYSADNWVKLSDDELIGTHKKGELLQIESIAGNVITFTHVTIFAYTQVENAIIRKITFTENVTIEGLSITGPGIENSNSMLYGVTCLNLRFINNKVEDFGYAGVHLLDSVDIIIDQCTFENIFQTGMGYSVDISNACDGIKILNNVFRKRGRHYIATGGVTGTYLTGGVFRNIMIRGNSFESSDAGNEAINTHSPAYGVMSIIDNSFLDCGKGIELTNTNSIITGNSFLRCDTAIHIDDGDETRQVLINGNDFRDCTSYACNIEEKYVTIESNQFSGSSSNIRSSLGYIDIIGNSFNSVGANAIICFGTVGTPSENVNVIDNSFCDCVTTPTIKATYVNNLQLTDNYFTGSEKIELQYTNYINCISNMIIDSIDHAIRVIDDSQDITISNNYIYNCTGRGISLEGSTTPNTPVLISNNRIDAGTPIYNDGATYINIRQSEQHIDILMDVLAVSTTHIRSNEDLSAGTPITFTLDAQPDIPRTLSWSFDSHAQITEYDMEVIGIDAKGNSVTETWDETAGWSGETSNAFATITSIKMTARTGTGASDTMDIGITDVIGLSNIIYETSDVFKIKKNNANATVATAQVNTTYDTYDMSVITLGAGDDFTIWYKSNLNIIS